MDYEFQYYDIMNLGKQLGKQADYDQKNNPRVCNQKWYRENYTHKPISNQVRPVNPTTNNPYMKIL